MRRKELVYYGGGLGGEFKDTRDSLFGRKTLRI